MPACQTAADDDLERMSDIQADRGIIAGLFDALLLVADGRGAPDRLWEGHADLAHERNRSEEHTSELQSLMRISYAVFCLKKKKTHNNTTNIQSIQATTTSSTTTLK